MRGADGARTIEAWLRSLDLDPGTDVTTAVGASAVLSAATGRDQRIADAELGLRLGLDTPAVERAFAALLEEALADGDDEAAVRSRIGLGVAAYARGDVAAAAELLGEAVATGRVSPIESSEVFVTLMYAYAHTGRARDAVELIEGCLAQAEEDARLSVFYSTYLGQALCEAGELARAESVLTEALDRADETTGLQERVLLHWLLSRIAESDNHVGRAVAQMRLVIALLESTGDERRLGMAHTNIANALISAEKFLLAGRYLHRAAALLAGAEPVMRASVRIHESRRLAGLGRPAEAVRSAREALELLGGEHPSYRGAANRALADGLWDLDERDAALDAYRLAARLSEETGQWREASDTCATWGKRLRSIGLGEQAEETLQRSARLAERIQSGRALRGSAKD